MHGTVDTYCTPEGAQAIFDRATGPKEIEWIETPNHIDIYDRPEPRRAGGESTWRGSSASSSRRAKRRLRRARLSERRQRVTSSSTSRRRPGNLRRGPMRLMLVLVTACLAIRGKRIADDEEPVDESRERRRRGSPRTTAAPGSGSCGPTERGRRHVAPGWPSAVWMRDSKHLVVDYNANDSCCNRAGLYVYDLDGRARRLPNGGDGRHPAISPDGRLVAFARGRKATPRSSSSGSTAAASVPSRESTDDASTSRPPGPVLAQARRSCVEIKPPPAPPPEPDPEPWRPQPRTDFFTTVPAVEPPGTPTASRSQHLDGRARRAAMPARLTRPHGVSEDSASWSPDGRLLAFSRQRREDIGEDTKAVVRNPRPAASGSSRGRSSVDGWRPA